MNHLKGWLTAREPTAPEGLLRGLEPVSSQGASLSDALGSAAAHHLGEALARPGRDREGAYHLLAADALLTYACEAATEEADTERVLARLLERIHGGVDGSPTPTGARHDFG